MRVVFINTESKVKEKPLTARQKLHNKAIEGMAEIRRLDEQRALKRLASKISELKELEKQLSKTKKH
jgi:hypothetical protein